MTRLAATTAFSLACLIAPSAHAAHQMKGMEMKPTGVKTGTGVGVVKAVDARAGTVTLQHGPIPAVGWPAMTMAFKATSPAVMQAAKPGQTVLFGVRVTGTKAEVTSIQQK